MTTLTINIERLCTVETVRYNGQNGADHGYTINLLMPAIPENQLEINLSLEALIQLQQRINAALQHMITH